MKEDIIKLLIDFWYLWALCIVALIISLIMPKIKGKIGEKTISFLLFDLPQKGYTLLNDIMIPSKNGTTQIDHIVVSIHGIFVIETKNYKGLIYGNEKNQMWTQNIYGKKNTFRNPIHQNYGHVKAIETILKDKYPNLPFVSIVAFAGDAKLKIKVNQERSHVVYFGKVKKTIRSYRDVYIDKEQMHEIAAILKEKNIVNSTARKEHVKKIKSEVSSNKKAIKRGICPRCGGNLVKRNGKYGEFLGCSNFPKCKYTNNKI